MVGLLCWRWPGNRVEKLQVICWRLTVVKYLFTHCVQQGGPLFLCKISILSDSVFRSVLEDPPSISEGCGGRVTDYRIPDFGLLIRQNRLFPLKNNFYKEPPILKMKQRLARHTKYWPLTISSTLIFNLKGVRGSFHKKQMKTL